jgi:hypothetical protein
VCQCTQLHVVRVVQEQHAAAHAAVTPGAAHLQCKATARLRSRRAETGPPSSPHVKEVCWQANSSWGLLSSRQEQARHAGLQFR